MNDPRGSAPVAPAEPVRATRPHLPTPTAWPMVLAVGIALVLGGLALSVVFSIGGAIVFAVALYGWIQDLRSEGQHE